jgi:uncharacterized protein
MEVAELPDRPELAERVRAMTASVLPGLIGAHAAARPVALAWLGDPAGRGVRLLVSAHLAPVHPPGAQGSPAGPGVLAGLAGLPHWVRCTGYLDALVDERHQRDRPRPGPLFEQCLAGLLDQWFGWLVVAEPVPDGEVAAQLRTLGRAAPRLRELERSSEEHRVELTRAESRYRFLAQARRSGAWRVHLLAGAADAAAAVQVGALLAAALDLADQPYVLRPAGLPANLETTCATEHVDDEAGSPFLAGSDLLAALARPPVIELPGIRLVTANTFDATPESEGDLQLGTVIDRNRREVRPFPVGLPTINRHVFVCGATGAGKSQTVRTLLEQLCRVGVPWLVIEPAKAEYARMAGRLAPDHQVLRIRPGEPDVIPAGLNPLEPEPGFPLQTHLDLVRALFTAAFDTEEPFPQILSLSLTRCYQRLGWDLTLGEPRYPGVRPRYPTLGDLRTMALRVVTEIGYGREVADNVRGFVDVRIGSLRLGTTGRFFEGGHRLDVAQLLRRNAVLELEDIGNDQDKAFFIGSALIRLTEHLRVRHARTGGGGLRHVTVIEEAHRLLRRTEGQSAAAHSVELFASLLAEIRAYGEGIVVAEQIPEKISRDVVKNSALKIVHRLPAQDDRDFVGATMNLDSRQSQYVVALRPGQAAAFSDGMDRPVLVQMPLRETHEDAAAAISIPPVASCQSVTCGSACQASPCTLREINQGGRLAQDHEFALWIELLVAAHVLGQVPAWPAAGWLARLARRGDWRLLDCAVGQLVQAAVDRRYPELVEFYTPEELARHVAGAARGALRGEPAACDGSEVCWQAGSYRWYDVFQALTGDGHAGDRPHPGTGHWLERGLDLSGMPAATQLRMLRALPLSWRPDRTAIEGVGDPPEHVRLAAALSRAGTPRERLVEAASRFLDVPNDWPLRHLLGPG